MLFESSLFCRMKAFHRDLLEAWVDSPWPKTAEKAIAPATTDGSRLGESHHTATSKSRVR